MTVIDDMIKLEKQITLENTINSFQQRMIDIDIEIDELYDEKYEIKKKIIELNKELEELNGKSK